MTTFVDKIELVDSALSTVPHAFGGALALAYHVESPRATADIDLNIALPVGQARDVLTALPAGVGWTDDDVTAIERDGQVRVLWDRTPLDLFFPQDALHDVVASRVLQVPFRGRTIPIISATDLTIFKTLFDRPKDWVDIAEMLEYGSVDAAEALGWVSRLLGRKDRRTQRLSALLVGPDRR
ncbi:MAG: hypothetical protein ABR549_11890 [Mycobacteriales bacterium]